VRVPSPHSDLRRLLPAAAVAVLALVSVSSCDRGDDPSSSAPSAPATPTATATPLASLDTSRVSVVRASFCDRVAPTAVESAVDSHQYDDASYANGDHAQVAAGVRDVAHEYSCTWTAPDGTRARAWVFAPPVTPAQARALAKAPLGPGCRGTHGGARFGAPSVSVSCGPKATGAGTELGHQGLFGDAWLSCTLTAPKGPAPADLAQRADRWCAAVVQAASA